MRQKINIANAKKLTNIIKAARKGYYNKLLYDNINDLNGIWTILITVLKRGSKQLSYPQNFTINNTEKYDINGVVNSFNKFFVSVVPDLVIPEEQSDS